MTTKFDVGDVVYFRFGCEIHRGRVKEIVISNDIYYHVANYSLLTEADVYASEKEVMEAVRTRIIIHNDNESEDK
jgi:hypothetical protein